jgi:hypothetical protein
METNWKYAFLWSANPIPLEVQNTEKLIALYKDGADAFIKKSVDTCMREILTAVYRGHLETLDIKLDVWDIQIMLKVVCRVHDLFPSLDICWDNMNHKLVVGFQGLKSAIQKEDLFVKAEL